MNKKCKEERVKLNNSSFQICAICKYSCFISIQGNIHYQITKPLNKANGDVNEKGNHYMSVLKFATQIKHFMPAIRKVELSTLLRLMAKDRSEIIPENEGGMKYGTF